MVYEVEIFLKDAERASGIVIGPNGQRIPWTSVVNEAGGHFIILHEKITGTTQTLQAYLEQIQKKIEMSEAC